MSSLKKGLLLTISIAAAATLAGHFVPVVGAAVFSIVFGIVVRLLFPIGAAFNPGIRFSSKKLLQWGIVLMGFTLSFRSALSLGLHSLPVTLTTITAALLCSFIVGKWLGIPDKLRTLIGVGTAICGGSAIAAASPIIEADEEEVAFSISTIFLFNIIAVFLFPVLGALLHMTDIGFGYFAGTAINDTSSVVAAGYTFSKEAGDTATIVKLIRALMIVPVCLLLVGMRFAKAGRGEVQLNKIFPWLILCFFTATIFVSIFPLPAEFGRWIKELSIFVIAVALAGIGLSVDIKSFRTIGLKPILLGAITWAVVAVVSLIMQQILGIW